MKKQVYCCDVCGIEKREVNHWWLATTFAQGALTIRPWSADEAAHESSVHLCGQEHLQRFVAWWCTPAVEPDTTCRAYEVSTEQAASSFAVTV